MKPEHLDYEIILGAKINENMPEELRKIITGHIENVVGPETREVLRAKVIEYCEANDLEVTSTDSTETNSGIIKVDENGVADDAIADTALSSLFKKLGEKRGIKVEKNYSKPSNFSDLQEGIKELTNSLNPNSSDEDKSRAAFKILELKIKSLKVDYGYSSNSLKKEIDTKLAMLNSKVKGESKETQKLAENVNKEFQRSLAIVEQASASLDRLGSINEEEFMAQDYDSRGKYLKYMTTEITKSQEFLKEELQSIKMRLINTLSYKLGLGDHIGIVLGE